MSPFRACVLSLCIAFAAVAPAGAGECLPQWRDGWVRLLPANMPMTAGFGSIENPCPEPVEIVGVSSPAFGDVSLHETRIVDGVSRMQALPSLRIAAGDTATLAPSGLHLMLMQPRAPLQAGDKVAVDFVLKDGRILRGELDARPLVP